MSSSLFSFAKPIAGGIAGTPLKVLGKNPPRHDDDGSILVTPMGSYVQVEEKKIVAGIDENPEVAPESAEKVGAPKKLMVLNKAGRRFRLGKPKQKFAGKEIVAKDCVFNDVSRMPKINRHPSDSAVYRLTRMVRTDGFLASSTSLDTTGSLTFLLSALPGISDCTSLFDAYRVIAIECWILPRFQTNTDRAYNPGMLATAVDYDGGTATYDELSQYPNVMMDTGLAGHYRAWAPGVVILTPGPSSAGLVISPWLDCADTGVAHHGLNYGITPTSQVQTYDRVTRFHLEFKRVR